MADERDNLVCDDESEGGDGYVLVDTETPEPAVTSKSTLGVQPLHIMLASFVGSISIVFGVIPILIPSDSENFELRHLDAIPHIGRTVCSMVLLSLSTFFITWRSRAAITEERCTELSAKALVKILKNFCGFVVYHCPAIIQILVFATGSMVTCGLDIYNHSKIDHTCNSTIVENTFRILSPASRMLSLASQMVFYSWFMYDRPRQLPRGYYAVIALMIGVEAWLWISDTTERLWTVDHSNHTCIERNETGEKSPFTEGLQHFLEPFHVEFSTISFGLLYELWSFVPDKKRRKKALTHPSVSVSRTHKIISVLLCILYVSVITVILFAPWQKCENEFIVFLRLMIYKGFLFLLYGLFLLTVTFKALLSITSTDMKSSEASLSQYLLIITAILTFVFYILRIFAAGYDLHYDDIQNDVSLEAGKELFTSFRSVTLQKHWIKLPTNITNSEQVGMDGVMLTYPFFIIVQVWVQTQFLIEAQHHKVIPRFVQVVLVYIIMMNFAEWLQTGIYLGLDRDEGNSAQTLFPIMDKFYNDNGGRIIRFCLLPFTILYRFHSAVVAWEILIENGNEEDERRPQGVTEETEGQPNSLSINIPTSEELVG